MIDDFQYCNTVIPFFGPVFKFQGKIRALMFDTLKKYHRNLTKAFLVLLNYQKENNLRNWENLILTVKNK